MGTMPWDRRARVLEDLGKLAREAREARENAANGVVACPVPQTWPFPTDAEDPTPPATS